MPGLSLGSRLGGNVSVTAAPQASYGGAAAQAFGPGQGTMAAPSGKAALIPNRPFGIAFWVSVAAVAGLVVIRHSLPN